MRISDWSSDVCSSDLIVPLGQWAIGKAAEVLAEWDKQNGAIVDAYFSVNVSAIQLVRDDVAGVVRQALEKHKIGGERLMIELTESAIIGDPDLALSRSEEHTSELQSLMRISYAVFCLKTKHKT